MTKEKIYPGIGREPEGSMNPTGHIIRDAWVFGIIPETEDCAGWSVQGIQALYDKVSDAWAPYGHLPSRLPQDLREKHERIYRAATEQARAQGWDPDMTLQAESD